MLNFATNLNEEFLEVSQWYDWQQFRLDLLAGNSGDGLSPQEKRCLRAIALDLDRRQIAKKLTIQPRTVSDYLRKPYELIKILFAIEGKMTERKDRRLILSKYKKSTLSSSTSVQQFKADYEIDEDESLEDISSTNEYAWQTLDEVQPYIDNFHKLCEAEDYTEAFYTIFDTDNYENCVYKFLSLHGYLNIVIYIYERLIQSWIPRKGEKWEFITTLAYLGDAHDRMGNHEIAIGHYQNCLEIAEEIDDIDNIAGSLVNLGLAYFYLENYEEALDYSRLGLEIAREIGNREFEAHALNNLGMIYSDIEEYQLAIDYYHFSLKVKSKLNDPQGAAGSLINIGNTYRQLEKYEQAISYLQRGIEAAHHSHHNQFEANGWFNLALALKSLHHYSDAISAYEEAFNLYQQMEMIENVKDCRKAIIQMSKAIKEDISDFMKNGCNTDDFENVDLKNDFDAETSDKLDDEVDDDFDHKE
ncbi:tetratricopeptide repeat protein [Nostoc sp.]|uniref:tetratricopeptide repeat protein n=1 Tax=Nostoc sp. TaxID=1180 RepID=UPI002FF52435